MAANFGVGASLDPGNLDAWGDSVGIFTPQNGFSIGNDPAFDPFGGAPSASGFSIGNDPAVTGIQNEPAQGASSNTWLWVAVAALALLVVIGGE